MDRHVDNSLEKYWCSDCECFHKRRTKKGLSITFFSHIGFRTDISDSEIWKKKFKHSWNKEAKKQTHEKSINEV